MNYSTNHSMSPLRAFLFNVAFYGMTSVMCLTLLWALLLPRRYFLQFVHSWLNTTNWIERNIGNITHHVIGAEHIPPGACIIAAKHQSAWETFKLHVLFGDPAIVLKKELLNIPVWGWYLRRSGMIPIDRTGRAKALSGMMQAAHRAVAAGRKIVIFPQGTRTAPGAWRPYKSGVAALYQELNLPIVPMAHNSGLVWPNQIWVNKSGRITIEFLPPIPPGLERGAMMEKLQEELENASDRLLKAGI